MSSESSSVTSAPVRLTGRVKWFNNKTGFGFISVVGGDDQFKDASEIFVHHSAVTVSQEQYRYLVEGEYVEFVVVSTDSGTHKFQAGDVRGVKGGKLFCETRHEHRASQDSGAGGEKSERGRTQVRGGGGGGGGGVRGGRGGYNGGGAERGGERGAGHSGYNGGGERSSGRGGYSSRGGSRGEWMLVRQNHQEHNDSHGSERNHREGQSAEKRPTFVRAASTTQSSAAADEPETPRAAPAKKPRQSKPTA